MLKRKAFLTYSILCLVLLAAVFVGVNAQKAQAADQWVNNADVSWIDPSTKLVAITFDDGPVGTAPTASSQRILDVMEKYQMHCTYFYWGEKINDSNIAELQRAYALGCELGNHSFTHPYLTNMSAAQIKQEIQKTNDLLYPISGNEVTLIRPPYGSVNNTLSSNAGAPLINWSLDSADWNNGNYNSVVNNIRRLQDGDIILCHQTYDFTAQAMETLIPELIDKGYTIVTVSELMKMKGVTLTAGTTYTNQARGKKNITTNGFENIGITEGMIREIGTVTLESSDAIQAARAAYEALTAAQKARVSNIALLDEAEKTYAALVQSWNKVKQVIGLIDEIGEVTLDREEAIQEAREAYDLLLSDQKAQVTNYSVLTDAEAALEMLKKPLPFTDVSGWYESAVRYVYTHDLMNGVSDGEFDPKGTLTRAQLVAILYRAAGEPDVEFQGIFTDVKESRWYADAVEWAAANGIVNGVGNDKFDPNGAISRQQIVTILYRYENEPEVHGDLSGFADAEKVASYAVNALIWAVEQGVIEGTGSEGEALLSPKNNATRAQIAAIMMRYLQMERKPQLVTDSYALEKAYIDDCGNEYLVSCHIPQINLPGDAFRDLNSEIYDFFT